MSWYASRSNRWNDNYQQGISNSASTVVIAIDSIAYQTPLGSHPLSPRERADERTRSRGEGTPHSALSTQHSKHQQHQSQHRARKTKNHQTIPHDFLRLEPHDPQQRQRPKRLKHVSQHIAISHRHDRLADVRPQLLRRLKHHPSLHRALAAAAGNEKFGEHAAGIRKKRQRVRVGQIRKYMRKLLAQS